MSGSPGGGSDDADLDRTDILPIMAGTAVADDVPDDAVPLDYAITSPDIKPEFGVAAGGTALAGWVRSGELVALRASLEAEKTRWRETAAALDERSRMAAQLDAELRAVRARDEALAAELEIAQQTVVALRAERQQLQERIGALDAAVAARDASIAELQRAAAAVQDLRAKHERDLVDLDGSRAALTAEITALSGELAQLRDEALRMKESLVASEKARAELIIQVRDLLAHAATPPAPEAGFSAEFLRIDGPAHTAFRLLRRTRIGRAPGCELQIESSAVSRHHALVLLGQREVIIEDLNSTNGVLVNGRKVSRQLLNDGDAVTIGDAHFRVKVRARRASEAPPPKPP